MPKTLFGFYIKCGLKGYWTLFIIWMVSFFIYRAGNGFFKPLYQKWVVELFEQTLPADINFIQFAMPTITLIIGIWLFLDISDMLRHWIWAIVQHKTNKQI